MNKRVPGIHTIAVLLLAALLAACASMGRPEGGPRDVEPPVFMGSSPAPEELNVDKSRIVIRFDENVAVTDPYDKGSGLACAVYHSGYFRSRKINNSGAARHSG